MSSHLNEYIEEDVNVNVMTILKRKSHNEQIEEEINAANKNKLLISHTSL